MKLNFISNDINYRYKFQHNIDKFYEWSNSWQFENAANKSAALILGITNILFYTIYNVSIVNCSRISITIYMLMIGYF